jgi:hypothetical protein
LKTFSVSLPTRRRAARMGAALRQILECAV